MHQIEDIGNSPSNGAIPKLLDFKKLSCWTTNINRRARKGLIQNLLQVEGSNSHFNGYDSMSRVLYLTVRNIIIKAVGVFHAYFFWMSHVAMFMNKPFTIYNHSNFINYWKRRYHNKYKEKTAIIQAEHTDPMLRIKVSINIHLWKQLKQNEQILHSIVNLGMSSVRQQTVVKGYKDNKIDFIEPPTSN